MRESRYPTRLSETMIERLVAWLCVLALCVAFWGVLGVWWLR